jgi:hypothetical protein
MSLDVIDMGWSAFRFIDQALRQHRVAAAALVWCYAEENYGAIIAVFEIVRPPHPQCLIPLAAHPGHCLLVVAEGYGTYEDEWCPGVRDGR